MPLYFVCGELGEGAAWIISPLCAIRECSLSERRTSCRAEQVGNKMAAVIIPDRRAAFLLYDNGPFLLL